MLAYPIFFRRKKTGANSESEDMKSQMMDSNYLANNHTIPWKLRNHVGFTSSNTFWVPEIDKKKCLYIISATRLLDDGDIYR